MSDTQTVAIVVSMVGCAVLVLDKVVNMAQGWQKTKDEASAGQVTANVAQSTVTQLAVMQAELSGLRRDFTAWMERHDTQTIQIADLKERVTKLEARGKP